MAYIDDNHSGIPAGAGKDPLTQLDQELEQLRITLGELDTEPPAAAQEDPPQSRGSEEPAPERQSPPTAHQQPEQKANQETPAPAAGSPAPKAPRTGVIAAALALAVIGVAAGLILYFLNRTPLAPAQPTEAPTVTIHDSELGTVEITPPEDAPVNTYDASNLTLDANGYYAYTVDGRKVSEMGVDLSEYQGEIDFSAVKASGVDFVMLRIGGRTYGSGSLYRDDLFDTYYEQAKAAGLKVGVYFFSQAASREEGIEEAQYTLELLGDRTLDYPVAIDWETIDDDEARTDTVTGEILTEIAAAFCDTVEAAGLRSVVYASTSLILQSYDFEIMKNYDFWLADYRAFPEQEKMYYHFTMWQYSAQGTVPGIDAAVDMNLCLDAG